MIKVGSRVRYIKKDKKYDCGPRWYPPIGTLGTVQGVDNADYLVKWDKGTDGDGLWYCEHAAVEEVFNVKFNINDYKGNYVMHCETEKEAQEFYEYMDSIGKPLNCSLGCYYGKNVCFFNSRTWGNKEYAEKEGYTVLEWSDFMREFTKADLKTGDVVKFRNEELGIVNGVLEMIPTQDGGWINFDNTKDNLTNKYDKEWDIVAVRRPKEKNDCRFKAFEFEYGILVYERKEVEEMTLAEVCRLLGKEIKIVK